MKSRVRKRLIRTTLLVAAAGISLFVFRLMDIALRPTAVYSGLILFALLFFLAAYNVRKRIRFLPVGSAESWLQLHIYVGLFTGVLFGIHISWHFPHGIFEVVLAGLYLLAFLSGILGLCMSRVFSKRLTTRGDETLFDRIPARLVVIQAEVESMMMTCLQQTESTAIPGFYVDRLRPFFEKPRNTIQHLFLSSRPRIALLDEIRGFERYLNETERLTLEKISEKVIQKDGLDFQYALQLALKLWLFVHVPVTYALLVFATIHLLLFFAFAGSAP